MAIEEHTQLPLRCVELTTDARARGTVVYLHGMGATLDDMLPVADDTQFSARHVLVDGPEHVETGPHYHGRAWYQREEGAITGLDEAVEQLLTCLRKLEVAPEDTVLVGFSQGAAMALATALQMARPPAGICLLNGFVASTGMLAAHQDRVQQLYTLLCHGIHDDVVPLRDGLDALDRLSSLGARARLVALPTSHWVSGEMVVELRRFLDERLSPQDMPQA